VLNWLDWTHPLWGGAEVYLRETSQRMASRGHEVTVLSSTYDGCVSDEVLHQVRVARRGKFWTYGLELPWHYHRLVRERGAWDVILEYTNKVPLFSPLWAGRPVVAVAHHLWGRSIFAESPLPIAAAVWASEALIPLAYRHVPWLAVSESTRADLISRGIPAGSISLAPNGIDLPSAQRATGAPDPHLPRVAWVGRVRRYKRLNLLIEAMAIVRRTVADATLDVVGDGPALGEARVLAAQLGLGPDAVTFHGAVPDAVRDQIVGRARVLAQPSIKEGWGRTVLEAAALGVPSVVCDAPGLRDAVLAGTTGVIAPIASASAFARCIIHILTDIAAHNSYRNSCILFARTFNWDTTVQVHEKAVRSVTSLM
jgi:glycosyltransferase involved in cell wall biosynthesis